MDLHIELEIRMPAASSADVLTFVKKEIPIALKEGCGDCSGRPPNHPKNEDTIIACAYVHVIVGPVNGACQKT